ncbi:MAG: bifunctional riboflavin kinase/FAD synthetase [Bdellovibrionales bacterium]|nr:bifunctional riboflavin kinase/FAD synthetase [Bdellovibrionales bacterium]
MKTISGSSQSNNEFTDGSVVAIGNFDGIHLGHQSILAEAKGHAEKLGLPLVVYTFNPHPTLELKPQSNLKLLMTYEEKKEFLARYGADFCVEERFDLSFAALSAGDFFEKILCQALHARVIVVGDNFTFGRKREGSISVLREFCHDASIKLCALPPVEWENGVISSSRIREALGLGQVSDAALMLGRPFFYRSEVIHGDKRGRTIGFPTANMKCKEKFPLKTGVYATSVLWRGAVYPSVTNVGVRPTFGALDLRVETHILDQTLELYGELLEVRFHEHIREERKFSSIEELKGQISSDTILARKLLRSWNF